LQAVFDRIMPPGVSPLALFTTLARLPRIFDRFRSASLLDRGPVSMRQREILINRTCARCHCAYERGIQPFQALLDERGRYVIERSAVSYAPSLTILHEAL
jgi:hypothetical protein